MVLVLVLNSVVLRAIRPALGYLFDVNYIFLETVRMSGHTIWKYSFRALNNDPTEEDASSESRACTCSWRPHLVAGREWDNLARRRAASHWRTHILWRTVSRYVAAVEDTTSLRVERKVKVDQIRTKDPDGASKQTQLHLTAHVQFLISQSIFNYSPHRRSHGRINHFHTPIIV